MKMLARGAVSTSAGSPEYTVPTGYKTDVMQIDVNNTTSAPIDLDLHFVASGGSVSTSNMIFPSSTIQGNSMIQWTGAQVLNAGDFIQAIGSGAGLSIYISGNEISIR